MTRKPRAVLNLVGSEPKTSPMHRGILKTHPANMIKENMMMIIDVIWEIRRVFWIQGKEPGTSPPSGKLNPSSYRLSGFFIYPAPKYQCYIIWWIKVIKLIL